MFQIIRHFVRRHRLAGRDHLRRSDREPLHLEHSDVHLYDRPPFPLPSHGPSSPKILNFIVSLFKPKVLLYTELLKQC